ncbi:MAG: serine/threonine protein kinase [Dehalococcoidia bacterium]|nr:serine/threonine protein kinase [Dehalococcoidia bacterium]
MDRFEGELIDGLYGVDRIIGSGDFGTVYRVHHSSWRVDLAMKVPGPQTLASREAARLLDVRAWSDLGLSPYIAACYYSRELQGKPAIFIEYVAGSNMREKLRRPLEVREALDYAIQISCGLSYAHRHSLVHGNLKPENCLLAQGRDIKLTDFGLGLDADSLDGGDSSTVEYRSPEQWHAGDLTPGMDIFSFGVVLYEMLTGTTPFQRRSGEGVRAYYDRQFILGWKFPALPLETPVSLHDLVGECLKRQPAERPENFSAVIERLKESYRECTGSSCPRGQPDETLLVPASLNKKAVSLYDLGMKEEAVHAVEEAVKYDPSCLDFGYNHVLFLWEKGAMSDIQVVKWLEMKAESSAGEWRPLFYLGLAHLSRKDADPARVVLHEASKRTAAEKEIQDALEQLEKEKDRWPHFVRVLSGHSMPVSCSAISQDGKFALTGSLDGNLRYWNLASGECLRKLGTHKQAVSDLAFTGDGQFALSASHDKTLRFWDLRRGECVRVLDGHGKPVNTIAVSPDSSLALSGGDDKNVRVWALRTGTCLLTMEGHERPITSLAILPDGVSAISGSGDKTARIWDLSTGKCRAVLRGHERGIRSVAATADGRFALTASEDKTIGYWNLDTGKCLRLLKGHERSVNAVAVSPDGRFVISGGDDKTLRIWDALNGTCMRTINEFEHPLAFAAFSADGNIIVPGSDDKTPCVWHIGGLEPLRLFPTPGHTDHVDGRTSHDHDFALLKEEAVQCKQRKNWRRASQYLQRARSLPGYERHQDVLDLAHELGLKGIRKGLNGCWLKSVLRGHEDWINAAAFSPDGKLVLSASDDRTMRLWEVSTGENIRTFRGHDGRVSTVAMSPGGNFALSGSHDGTVRLWNLHTGETIRVLEGHRDWVSSVAISPDGSFALSGSDDGSLCVWSLMGAGNLRRIEDLKSPVRSLAITPDGSLAVSGSDDEVVRVWDIKAGKCTRTLEAHENWVNSVSISSGGTFALSGSLDGTVRLWDLKTGICLRTLNGHRDWVRSVAFSPGSRFALSGGHDRALRLWDLKAGETIHLVKGHQDWVSTVTFSPDGRYAVSGGHDSVLRLWEFDWCYDFPVELDWAEAALPYLEIFITMHKPRPDDEIRMDCRPSWTDQDFEKLLDALSRNGFGWLKPAGIARKLSALFAARDGHDTQAQSPSTNRAISQDSFTCGCCGQTCPIELLDNASFCPECQQYLAHSPEQPDQGSWWKKIVSR